MNYKKSPDKTIEETWTELSKLARKIAHTQSDMKGLSTPERRLQTLLQSLPAEYDVIRDAIDAQDNPDHERAIQKLQEKEAQLLARTTETAMWAKRKEDDRTKPNRRHIPNRRRYSSSSEENHKRRPIKKLGPKTGCFLCGEDHRIIKCDYLKKLQELIRKAKRTPKKDDKFKSHKHRAYNAEDDSNLSDPEVVMESEEEFEEEIAALSKEMVSKIPKSHWVADTGASSHMTDQLQLFRGPLTPIKRRVIRVEGGRLYSDQCGTAIMRVENGQTPLARVLYVPELGVNLLSGKRLCEKGLRGSFDTEGLYIHNEQGKQMLRAQDRGGVYIVDKVAAELDEFALMTIITRSIEAGQVASTALPALANLTDQSLDHSDSITQSSDHDMNDNFYNGSTNANSINDASSPTRAFDSDIHAGPKTKLEIYKLWHRRFAHLGSAKLRNLHKVTTLKKSIPIIEDHDPCEVCALTKLCNKRNHTVAERKPIILALISVDICGPLPASRLKYEYFLEIVDNHSRRTWILFLRQRSDAVEALRKWKLKIELQSGAKLQAVRSDNATELKSILDEWCSSIGITPQYTVPYNSIQNGVAERGIRTTENQIRAMIKDAELPIEFWPEAGGADAYIRNRVATGPIVDGNPTTPMEAFTGVKPSIDHLRVWGCKCYSPVDPRSLPDNSRKDKLMNRGRPGVFLGYDEETDTQYYIWAPDLRKLIKHHKVTFAEHKQWGSADLNLPVQTPNVLPVRRPVGRPRKVIPAISKPIAPEVAKSIEPVSTSQTSLNDQNPERQADKIPQEDEEFQLDQEGNKIEVTEDESAVQTRAKAAATAPQSKMVKQFLHVAIPKRKREDKTDEEERFEHRQKIARAMTALLAQDFDSTDSEEWALAASAGLKDQFANTLIIPVPESYQEAINDPIWGKLWLEAIQAELTALIANGTWKTVVPPRDANIMTSKWVFKAKMHIDGTLDKLKARLVARGFSQMFGVDYMDTFAPTVKFDTLRLFLVIVALEDLECHQVNVNNAFTESFLKEVIYMKPPPGVDLPPGKVLLIRRSLYGLKQAARDWHERCIKELRKLGFEQTLSDPCMLRHPTRNITLLIYVDDICIAARSIDQVKWFKNEFQKVFKVKDLGEMKKILGIRVTRDRKNRTLRMNQTHYLTEVLDRLHMSADKHTPTELPMNGYDSLRPAGPNDERINQRDYQHVIGSIMYAAIHTRPDIAFAVGRLSQYLSDPAGHHGQALKSLLRYIRSTVNKGIVYGDSGSSKVIGYSDSDYAADKLDRKSILGYVYMLAGGPVSWMSRKQKSVATSTTEAEYMALSTCAKEGMWMVQLLKDMSLSKYLGDDLNRVNLVENAKHEAQSPVQLKGDNQAANSLVKDAHIHERSKHIDVAYHHVRDLSKRNLIQLDYIPSADMIADGLTKPLSRDKFKSFVTQLGLQEPKDNES